MSKVDAHHHLWNPARADYFWMPEGNLVLDRQYSPADLTATLRACDVSRTVLVQAAPTVEETEYMLGLADATDWVAGVVGWIDFERPEHLEQLQRLARHPKFRGVRPMIQDIPDVDWMLMDDVQWAYQAITDLDLTFDALGFSQHLANFLTLFERYPDMRVVIDHCMKPEIAAGSPEKLLFWAEGMTRIAESTGAYCKLSGLVTEAAQDWVIDDLEPFATHVLKAFGPQRVMWGSDWPVSRLRTEYEGVLAAAEKLTATLSESDRARVFGGTAKEFYRL